MFLEMRHQSDTERVSRVESLSLNQKMHCLRQTFMISDPGNQWLAGINWGLLSPERFNTAGFVETRLYFSRQLTTLLFGAGMILEVTNVLDCHLNDLCLLDPAATFLQVWGGNQATQISETIIHPVSAPLLNNSVGHWILGRVLWWDKRWRSVSLKTWLGTMWLDLRNDICKHGASDRAHCLQRDCDWFNVTPAAATHHVNQ